MVELISNDVKLFIDKARDQTREYVEEEFKGWDARALKSARAKAQKDGKELDDAEAQLWLRLKVMSKKDSSPQDASNWLVRVKEVMEDGSIKIHPDASVLKSGNLRVQPGIELSSIMHTAKEGFVVDYQVRDILILERLAGVADATDIAIEADPSILDLILRKRKAAEEKKEKEVEQAAAGPAEPPAKKTAPAVESEDDE